MGERHVARNNPHRPSTEKTSEKSDRDFRHKRSDPVGTRKSTDAMSNRTKQRRSGGLTLLLYQRALHPELFKIHATEPVSRRVYEADIWLVEGGHVISLTAGKNTFSEVIVTSNDPLTDRGLLQSIPCRGEKYHEMTAGSNIKYMIS